MKKRLGRWHINTATNGQYYAVLKAANGKVICLLETEKRVRSVLKSIESVRRNAPGEIVDNTGRG